MFIQKIKKNFSKIKNAYHKVLEIEKRCCDIQDLIEKRCHDILNLMGDIKHILLPVPSFGSNYSELRKGKDIALNSSFFLNTIGNDGFSCLNKLKVLDLKYRIRNGAQVRVCFLIDDITKLTTVNVYWAMKKMSLFEPFLYFIRAGNNELSLKDNIGVVRCKYNSDFCELKKLGYNVYKGYDDNWNPIPIDSFRPDIVFTSAPYLSHDPCMTSNVYLNTNYLVCFIYYGMSVANTYTACYNNRLIATAWKYFLDSRFSYEEILRYSQFSGTNAVFLGYPKLDDWKKPLIIYRGMEKFDKEKPLVIYAPHWSINGEELNFSTFHLYHDYFLSLAKTNKNVNFVFKPHPVLNDWLEKIGMMCSAEYDAYIHEWESLPNAVFVGAGDYIELFKQSDLLITDCVSFLAEWLPGKKPCICLVNPEIPKEKYLNQFSIMGKQIIETYYQCHNEDEITSLFSEIVFEKYDPKRSMREELVHKFFINIGTSGKKIAEYIEAELLDSKPVLECTV